MAYGTADNEAVVGRDIESLASMISVYALVTGTHQLYIPRYPRENFLQCDW